MLVQVTGGHTFWGFKYSISENLVTAILLAINLVVFNLERRSVIEVR